VDPARGPGSLGRATVLFGLGAFAGKVAGLVALPIFARLLTPAEFGRLDVLNALLSALILALLLGTDVAATRLYFDRHDPRGRGELLASWYALGLGVIIPIALALVILSDRLSRALFATTDLAFAIDLVGVIVVAGMAYTITLGVLRTTGRPLAYALLEGGALTANAVVAIAFLAWWRADATSVMLALAVIWSAAAVLGLWAVNRSVAAAPSRSAMVELLRLGLPLAPAVAATLGADFLNRAYLLGSSGATEAGYLSIAIRIASVAGLIVVATQLAWQPHAYRLGESAAALARLASEARVIVIGLSAAVGVIGLLSPEIVAVVGAGRYGSAVPAVGLALIGMLGSGLFAVASLRSAMTRATRDIGASALVGVGCAVALNLILAPRFGATGTAAAIAAGQSVPVAVVAFLGRRTRLPAPWPRLALIAGASVVVVWLGASYFASSIGVRAVLLLGFVAFVAFEGTLIDSSRALFHGRRAGAAT